MSRVHDALRRAEQFGEPNELNNIGVQPDIPSEIPDPILEQPGTYLDLAVSGRSSGLQDIEFDGFLSKVKEIPFVVAPESHLIDLDHLHEMPGEEFRSLRTRLNHIQTQQHIHSIVVTSASPAEGKTFTAANLAMAQAQLAESAVLLADFDLRRPVIHNLFQTDRSPGLSDYLLDGVPLEMAIRRIGNTNLHFLPAGSPVKNPLELLNLRQVKTLVDALPRIFNWIIIDTPPLLFSADANLLSTLTDGTIMVVRIGATTYDNVIRAMQSLCENNVLGIVANGARASELYSKYTYYYSKQD
jgi:capsular exopolysaccharide synthesis family protein